MKYDFDQPIDRKNSYSIKWDVKEHELPMWVADMDFKVSSAILNAINNEVEIGAFGYTRIPEIFYEAYVHHFNKFYNLNIKKEQLIYCSGVISAIDEIFKTFAIDNDGVVLLTPIYNTFFSCIKNNKLKIFQVPLIYKNYQYEIDFKLLEDTLSNPEVKFFIFCNPHNPIGKIWDKNTIDKIYSLCLRYNVILLSDEIHGDISSPNKKYVSLLSINGKKDNLFVLLSPSKAYNLAGLQSATIFVDDLDKRNKLQENIYHDDLGEPNIFAIPATIAAYYESDDWLEQVNAYIYENKAYISNFLKNSLPNLHLINGDATYLIWIDISSLNINQDEFVDDLRKKTGLYILSGTRFGNGGDGFIRINVATTRDNVIDAMIRLKRFVDSLDRNHEN